MNATQTITGDLIRLSDLFRRAVEFDHRTEAENLVRLTRELGCMLTYFYPELKPTEGPNPEVLKKVQSIIMNMDAAAQSAGLKALTLPLHKENPLCDIIRDHILDGSGASTAFEFRQADYKEDLELAGFIRPQLKTFLDEGIRGLGAIASEIKYKWDREIRTGGQLKLEL